jgi:hypothetical protein
MKKVLMTVCVLGIMLGSMNLSAQEWYEKIKLSGDFRNRFEYISDDTVKDSAGDVVKRYRERIRLRVGATAEVAKDLKVGFRLASGESADPVSTNQSLTTGFSKKGVTLDLAYAEYKASESSSLYGLNMVVGKMNNPFFKPGGTDLIWDNDISPEGLFAAYSHSLGEKFNIKALLGGFWAEERSKAADSGMLAFELIGTFKPTEKLSFDLGFSYYNYGNTEDSLPFFDATKGFGNSTNAAVAPATAISYTEDFDLMKIGFEMGYNFDFAPVKFFVDFVNNSGADGDLDTGFLVGFSVGKISGPKTWAFSFSYRNLEADATIGAFADSDISGGGTDIKGARVAMEYAIYKNWIVGATVFIGDKKIETSSDSYTRVQLDMNFKF